FSALGRWLGGYAALLLGCAVSCASNSRLQPGQNYTTTDLRISYLRALSDNVGPVTADGHVVPLGRSTAAAEGRLYEVDDRLYT
ncbi:PaaI family thioesterase, partial [Pseudomonas aeruginosa]